MPNDIIPFFVRCVCRTHALLRYFMALYDYRPADASPNMEGDDTDELPLAQARLPLELEL